MRVTLIHNPVAGDDEEPAADELMRIIRAAGHDLAYRSAKDGDWSASLEDPGDLVVVAGGDGTIGRVARRLIDTGIPLTFLPIGTANNIARTFGLADLSLRDLVDGWVHARARQVDVGMIESRMGARTFIEGLGLGLFVSTMIEIDEGGKLSHLEDAEDKITHAVHLLSQRLREHPARPLKISLDGKDLSGDYLMLEAMNIRFLGPSLDLAPASDPTDGLLDVVLVTESERARLQRYLESWRPTSRQAPDLVTHRGKRLQVEWTGGELRVDDGTWPLHHDGEHSQATVAIDVKLMSNALIVLVPTVRDV